MVEHGKMYCIVNRVAVHFQILKVIIGWAADGTLEGYSGQWWKRFGTGGFLPVLPRDTSVCVFRIQKKDEMSDVISCTRGHGFQGVFSRWFEKEVPVSSTIIKNEMIDVIGCIRIHDVKFWRTAPHLMTFFELMTKLPTREITLRRGGQIAFTRFGCKATVAWFLQARPTTRTLRTTWSIFHCLL